MPERILAGPIVRSVGAETATVWIALAAPANVSLEVYDGDTLVATGTQPTIASCDEPPIHIAAVVARVTGDPPNDR